MFIQNIFQNKVRHHNEELISDILLVFDNQMNRDVYSANSYRSDEYMAALLEGAENEAIRKVCERMIDC